MAEYVERELFGKNFRMESGDLAKQANGAVLVSVGDTVVLVTAVCSEKPREGIDFFPLTVDYEEKLYAAGKIPGGFIKKEGRPTEKCILTSRLIDRPIRPLFPEGFRNDVQIIGSVFSADPENDPDIPALNGASAALVISDIPFKGPIGAVRIGLVDGEFVVNPTDSQLENSLLNLVVAGTRENIMMVEAGAEEVSEKDVVDALNLAHKAIREIIDMQLELAGRVGKPKRQVPLYEPDRDLEALIRSQFTAKIRDSMRLADKQERERALAQVERAAMIEAVQSHGGAARERLLAILTDQSTKDFETVVKKIMEEELKTMIADEGRRPDGRRVDEIRPIGCQVGLLPRPHGSALFTRGQTQVMTTCTLGALGEEQIIDGLNVEEESKRYMHHYYFPPFSVGETKPMRGPGRREIGHGALAERGLECMIPDEEKFPYTIRLVSEVLESNGSTSMASTCGSTLALMDAGVPILAPVAGIAMGLVNKGDKWVVLTDIQGMEDALGEMDFKVAGSKNGITALQMDIKLTGLPAHVLGTALEQARQARLFILERMVACIPQPRAELSPHAPRIFTMNIHPDKIREVIGPGGKMIHKIIAETGAKIDIEDDGRIFITSPNITSGEKAKAIIEDLTRDVEVGKNYTGRVTRIMNFGAFVEILPGKEGLVHISQLSDRRVGRVEDVVQIGSEVTVKVTEIDRQGRINLTCRLDDNGGPSGDRRPGGREQGRPPHRKREEGHHHRHERVSPTPNN